ncbi:MAG TPA: trypsin-like serine protease [Labilithrix sp.]|nr:trypsin-like serine protease [Labilithrix sp.]
MGCASSDAPQTEELAGNAVSQPIVNGQSASAYTEAALINTSSSICSGAVIAPRVVLTAGHCLGAKRFTVVAPYTNQQRAIGSKTWTPYVSKGGYVNSDTLDVGVIILDTPITLSWYPPLASAPVAAGTSAVNVGRVKNGSPSYSGLFYGAAVTLRNGNAHGFPFAYVSNEVIQSGDSGGPVYVGSGANRMIAAVNSGSGYGTQVLARVDLAYAKIQELIAENGGAGGGTSGGGTSGGTSSGGGDGACSSNESEPNDTYSSPDPLGVATCGKLEAGGDVDWFTWEVGGAGVAYEISLAAAGDADILMWKRTSGGWAQITNTTPTKIAASSSGAGEYVVAVRSVSQKAQSYTLSLRK